MNVNAEQTEVAKLQALAEQYAQEGFAVILKPLATSLPFDLGGYRPDLIATKENCGLMVEVRARIARLPVERLRTIAEEVACHPGWRFLLVTLDDEETSNLAGLSETMPAWPELSKRLQQAHHLLANGIKEPVLLYVFGIFEASLRKRATETFIPIERFPLPRLINHMYSLGEISVSQYDIVMAALQIRNKITHGSFVEIDENIVDQFLMLTDDLISDWTLNR
ncbi:MAG: hypothetical protein ACKN9T_12265 [Candidatus Methylumidiphilus sp.]